MVENLEPGCYFDASFGFDYNAHRIMEFALNLGYDELEEEDAEEFAILQNEPGHGEPADLDIIVDVLDNVEAWLNAKARGEKWENTHYWGFREGDFGLWAIEEEDF